MPETDADAGFRASPGPRGRGIMPETKTGLRKVWGVRYFEWVIPLGAAASEIALADVLAAFRSDDSVRAASHSGNQLDRVLAEIDGDMLARTKDLRFDQLV